MFKHIILVAALGVFNAGSVWAEDSEVTAEELIDGITFTDGIFFPTHSISGMTYNPETKNYEAGATFNSTSGGGHGISREQQALLHSDYLQAVDKTTYLRQRTSEEIAALYQYAGTDGGGLEEQNAILGELDWRESLPFLGGKVSLVPRAVAPFYYSAGGEDVAADLAGFNTFLRNLSAAEVGGVLSGAGYGHDRISYAGVDLSEGWQAENRGVNSEGVTFVFAENQSGSLSLAGLNLQGATGLTAQKLANSGGWSGSQWIGSKPLDLRGTGVTREALAQAISELPLVNNGRDAQGTYLVAADDPSFSRYAFEWPIPENVGGGTKIMVIFDGDTIYPDNIRQD